MYCTMKDIELIYDDVYDLIGEYSVLTYLSFIRTIQEKNFYSLQKHISFIGKAKGDKINK